MHLFFYNIGTEVCSLSLGLKEIPAGVSDPAGKSFVLANWWEAEAGVESG